MKITALPRHSLVDEVCEQLSRAICEGLASETGLLPAERKLAEQFGVSRPVVREAFQRLEFQGLVEVRQGRGVQVVDRLHAPITAAAKMLLPQEKERLLQSIEVRAALEPKMARLAAAKAKRKDKTALRKVHDQLATADDLETAMDADLAFHHELARISGNQLFSLMLDSIAELGRESRRETMTQAGVEVAVGHHEAILQAILDGDGDAAEATMAFHLEVAADDLLEGAAKG